MSLAVSQAVMLQNVALAVRFPHHLDRGRSRPDPYLSAGRDPHIDPSRPVSAPKTPFRESMTSTGTRGTRPSCGTQNKQLFHARESAEELPAGKQPWKLARICLAASTTATVGLDGSFSSRSTMFSYTSRFAASVFARIRGARIGRHVASYQHAVHASLGRAGPRPTIARRGPSANCSIDRSGRSGLSHRLGRGHIHRDAGAHGRRNHDLANVASLRRARLQT